MWRYWIQSGTYWLYCQLVYTICYTLVMSYFLEGQCQGTVRILLNFGLTVKIRVGFCTKSVTIGLVILSLSPLSMYYKKYVTL